VSPVATATNFQQLVGQQSHDSPYQFDKIFSSNGWGAKSLSKKKLELLKKIDGEIRKAIDLDEVVYFISWGVRSSFWESYFLGALMYYINRMAFVFTTKRILLIQISTRNKPLELRQQIRYEAIEKISTPLGRTKIKFRDGSKTVFIKIPKRDRKYIREVINHLAGVARNAVAGSGNDAVKAENLCPPCFASVEGFPERCARCSKGFKSARKAALLSLTFPGLGDFYLGHRFFAAIEFGAAGLIWLGFLWPDPQFPMTFGMLVIGGLFVFVFVHGIDALTTRHIGKKGIYPASES